MTAKDCASSNLVGSFGKSTIATSSENVRKICFIQGCRNTSMRFPNLYFFEVPSTDIEAKKRWLTIARREEHINNRIARWYCCEEHFEPNDIENYEQFKQQGATPILKTHVFPHILPISTPSLPLPKRANLEEWDKFKRRLIRAVSRLLFKEKKPEDEVWAFLKKETGCDCLLLWDRMRSLTLKKMSRLLLSDDTAASIPSVARMTLTDWLMCDLVLVHEDIDVIGRKPKPVKGDESINPITRDHHPLISLFSIVQKFNVEDLEGESLALAWSAASKYYNTNGRQCSPMLLQRRWYQLKEWTRTHFYEFWHSYRGNRSRFELNKAYMPGKLQRAIARRFNHVITEPFCEWEQLVTWEKVILPEHFEAIAHRELPAPNQDDDEDLILLEQAIETINVDSDDDSGSKEAVVDDAATNFETNVASEMEDCGFDPTKVKEEPITEIDIEEHEFDKNALLLDSTRKALEEVDKAFALHETTSVTDNVCDNNIIDEPTDTEKDVVDIMETANLDQFDETAQSGFEIQMPMITNVIGNIEEKELSNLSAKSLQKLPVEDVQEVVLVDANKESPKSVEKPPESVEKPPLQNDQIPVVIDENEDDEDNVEDIIKITIDDDLEESKNETSLLNTNVEKQVLMECDVTKDKVINLGEINDFDESSDGVSFMDEGIAFLDDGVEEDDLFVIKNEPINNPENKDEADNGPKFDLKLLMEPVVYTTKVDQMQILKNKNIRTVKLEPIIETILEKESKPVSKQSISYKQNLEKEEKKELLESKLLEKDLDDGHDHIKMEPVEIKVQKIEIDDDFDIEHERIKLTNHMFQKPKSRVYTPLQICKNPDFNTRLKRLNMGFYNYERNIQYLNMCKPLTIDLHKAFECKLVEGTLYLNSSESINNQPRSDDDHLDQNVNMNIVPYAGPVQSLMNVAKPTSDELLAVSSSATMIFTSSSTTEPMEANNDVIQVNRLNSTMPQPCLLSPSTAPPNQICNPQSTNKTLLPNVQPSSKANEYIDKRSKHKERLPMVRPKPRNSRPMWFAAKYKPAPKLDEFLIQPDVLFKMLGLMNHGKKEEPRPESKKERKKLWTKARKMFASTQDGPQDVYTQVTFTKDNPVQIDKEAQNHGALEEVKTDDSTKQVDTEEAPLIINEDKTEKNKKQEDEVSKSIETQTDEVIDVDQCRKSPDCINIEDQTNTPAKVKTKFKKYCCWAQRKIVNIGKKHYIKHNCPLDNCTCCCMEEFQKKITKYRNNLNSYKKKVQVEMLIEKEAHSLSANKNKMQINDQFSKPILDLEENTHSLSDNIPPATSSKPVAHIKIIPKSSSLSDPIISETGKMEPKPIPKTRPSIIVDGTTAILSRGETKCPIFIGKNKVLLTSMKLPAHLDISKAPENISAKIITKTPLPPGVHLLMLPNGSVSFKLDPNTKLTQKQIDQIPKILSAVQNELGNKNIVSCKTNIIPAPPKKNNDINNAINTSEEIVISDDDEPREDTESDLTNKSQQNINQNTEVISKTPVTNRNSLLSDLMQMSGISLDDTVSEVQPPVNQNQVSEDGSIASQTLDCTIPVNGPDACISEDRVTSTCNVLPDVVPSTTIHLESSSVDDVPKIMETGMDVVTEGITAISNILAKDPEVNESPAVLLAADSVASMSSDGMVSVSVNNITSEMTVTTGNIASKESASELTNVHPVVFTVEPVIEKNPNIIRPSLHELTMVTSFSKLKYVVENQGQFFKLDLDTGIVVPINVNVKKKAVLPTYGKSRSKKNKTRIATIETEEIDLTEDDLPQNNDVSNSLKENYSNALQKILNPTEPPRPVKLIKAIQPRILQKRKHSFVNRPSDILVLKQKQKQRLMARIVRSASTVKSTQIQIIDSDEDDLREEEDQAPQQPNIQTDNSHDNGSDSSDDEPLSKISKKLHMDKNSTETESTSKINDTELSVDGINELPTNEHIDKIEELMATSISSPTAMDVDSIVTSLNIDLENEPTPSILIRSQPSFNSFEMPNNAANNDESNDDCILGV